MVVLNDNQHIAHLNADFANVLDIIQDYRGKALQTINHASVMTAWHVGAYVSNKIKNAQWGAKVVQQLAEYIHTQDPTLKGWSKVTIYRMVKLYDTYSSQQFVSYIDKLPKNILANSQQLVSPKMTQIPNLFFIQRNFEIINQRFSHYSQSDSEATFALATFANIKSQIRETN